MKPMLIAMLLSASGPVIASAPDAGHDFLQKLQPYCGKAYAGHLASDPAVDADMASQNMIMHVASCTQTEVRIPFFVGDDRSRTWFLTATKTGLKLKHRHRHADGSLDQSTNYGGDHIGSTKVEADGTLVVWFPADAESKEMFAQQNMPQSIPNVWEVRLKPGQSYTYRLWRPSNRDFRVEFDLTKEVPAPAEPWGGL